MSKGIQNIIDACVQDILETPDEEILREYEEDNLDIEKESERIRNIVNSAIDEATKRRIEKKK